MCNPDYNQRGVCSQGRCQEVKGFVEVLSRKEIIQKSLDNFGYILIAEDMDEAIEAANEIASGAYGDCDSKSV